MEIYIKNILITLSILNFAWICTGEHEEDIPYQQVADICKTCACGSSQNEQHKDRYTLSCENKGFKHILARWPEEFGQDHLDKIIVSDFSKNSLLILQQLPATNATLIFVCRYCGIKEFQQPTFMDVPNINYLDLSHNNITTTALSPDVFRGPFHESSYEPIGIVTLNLAFNQLHALDKKLFEHTPLLSNLSLSYNPFKVLDISTISAISSVRNLMHLDLSYTDLETIPSTLFSRLYDLKTLNLAGNAFKVVPDSLWMIGKTLETLNLAHNPFKLLNGTSLKGLINLAELNLSFLSKLAQIENNTFLSLEKLQFLYLSKNPQLMEMNLQLFLNNTNLKLLDISHNHLQKIYINSTQLPKTNAWPQLRSVRIQDNPLVCDCALVTALNIIGMQNLDTEATLRCMQPFQLAGHNILNLNASVICSTEYAPRILPVNEQPHRFLRRKYVMQYIYCSLFVIVVGVMIGFLIVYVKRRIKREDFGTEPIRYTSVRSSNVSAISQLREAEQRRSDRMGSSIIIPRPRVV